MELTVEQMVGKLLSFYNGIHGEFFKEVADKLISLEKVSTPSPSADKVIQLIANNAQDYVQTIADVKSLYQKEQ